MKKFFNRVRSYISDHFTCSNPNCDYVTEYDGSGNKRCPVCGAWMMEE